MPLLDPVSSWLLRRAAKRRDEGYDALIAMIDGIPDDGETTPERTSDVQFVGGDLHTVNLRPGGDDQRADVVVLVQFTRPGIQISISELLLKRPPETCLIKRRHEFEEGRLTADQLIEGGFPAIPVAAMHDERDLVSHTLDPHWSAHQYMIRWTDLRTELETLRP